MTAFLIITALILLNGIFVAAEFAIVGAPRASIDARAARGNRLAKAVQVVLRDPTKQDRYIATAQLGITVASLGLGMYGEHVLADWIYQQIAGAGAPAWLVSHGLASVIAIAILTYFHIVVGEMIPKSLALQQAETMALWITPPMLWIKTLVFPLVVGLNEIGNALLRLFGINRQAQNVEQYYTPEELQLVVQESEERGAIRAESGQMLQVLFDFANLTAAEVMVPRVRITGLPLGSTPDRIRELLGRTPHTRYPVVEHDLDHIVGMIHIKDLLRLLLRNEPIGQPHARPLPLVPETAPLDSVLATMRRERTQMVVVLDEHGGTAGIVTLEDSVRGSGWRYRRGTRVGGAAVSRSGRTPARSWHDAARRARQRVQPRPRARGGGQRQRPGPDAPRPATCGRRHSALRPPRARGHGRKGTRRRRVRRVSGGLSLERRLRLLTPSSYLANVNARTLERVRLVLAQDFARDRRRVAFAERQELQQVDNRIAFGPPEVGVRDLPGLVADVDEERRDGVGDRRADAAQHAVLADLDAFDVEVPAELGHVSRPHFQEEHLLVGCQVVRIAGLAQLVLVLLGKPGIRSIGDDSDRAPAGFVHETAARWHPVRLTAPAARSSAGRAR